MALRCSGTLFRAGLRSRLSTAARTISASPITRNTAHALAKQEESVAAEETEDIKELDRLLKVVRARSNPDHNALVPMRGSIPWVQTLLDSSRKESSSSTRSHDPEPLTQRSMHDSYTEIFLPFESSPELMEQYTNAAGGIRTGKLMEHLDSLAGSISYKHMLGSNVETLGPISERGFYIVTASVDRLDMLAPISPVRNLRLSGHVIHVGNSSMEVAVKMEALNDGAEEKTLMLGRFSMVCRDAFTHKAHPVNPLKVSTPEERGLYGIGEMHKRRRSLVAKRSLSKVPPSSIEAEALHSFILEHGNEEQASEQRVWMGDTKLERTMMMFPQERNLHQKIFGGYLMRLAYEVGFTNSSLFTREPVRFLSLDNISFAKPVSIGSILRLTSHILHTSSSEQFPAIVHVRVLATVVDVESGTEQMTNDFRFTWCREEGAPLARKVVPKTYSEAMLWLEGKRALDMRATIEGLRTSKSSQL